MGRNMPICVVVNANTNQNLDLVKEGIDLVTPRQTNVALAKQTSYPPLDVSDLDPHEHHNGYCVVQHDKQQSILVMFQSPLVTVAKRLIPAV